MHQFTCHVTRRDEIARRVEVSAADLPEARRIALAGLPGRVSCRADTAPVVTRGPTFSRRSGDFQ